MNGLGLVLWVVLGGAPAPWRLTAAYRDLRVRLVQADGGCASYATWRGPVGLLARLHLPLQRGACEPSDAVVSFNGAVLRFHREWYERQGRHRGESHAVRPIAGHLVDNWPAAWNRLDAAVHLGDSSVLFFRDATVARYWISGGADGGPRVRRVGDVDLAQRLWPDAPVPIRRALPDWPYLQRVDAAVNLGDGTILVLAGEWARRYAAPPQPSDPAVDGGLAQLPLTPIGAPTRLPIDPDLGWPVELVFPRPE
ncbi:MAG: hypothetical protein H6702_12270 [Myxococcales bacterium]|nr:hypothetical protein [Myxococcales bacterium]